MANDAFSPYYGPTGGADLYGGRSKLQSFQNSLQQSGNPNARPESWFLTTGTKKVNVKPAPQGGKWLCTMLLRKKVISWNQFYRMARGHALAILRFPNFAYWYLTEMGEIVRRAEEQKHEWKYFPIQKMEFHQSLYGFHASFDIYRRYCLRLREMYAPELPHPGSVRFGTIKLMASKWFWSAIPTFMKYQWRLLRA